MPMNLPVLVNCAPFHQKPEQRDVLPVEEVFLPRSAACVQDLKRAGAVELVGVEMPLKVY